MSNEQVNIFGDVFPNQFITGRFVLKSTTCGFFAVFRSERRCKYFDSFNFDSLMLQVNASLFQLRKNLLPWHLNYEKKILLWLFLVWTSRVHSHDFLQWQSCVWISVCQGSWRTFRNLRLFLGKWSLLQIKYKSTCMNKNIALLFQDQVHGFVVSMIVRYGQNMNSSFILL